MKTTTMRPLLSALALALTTAVARAQPAQTERLEIDDCAAKPQAPVERLRQLAGEHYDRGDVLYVQGDYVGAVSELVSSYCLIPHYRVLKDIGQAYERQLEYSRAIAYLRRYVAGVPDDAKAAACAPDPIEDKRNVSARIEVLSTLPARIRVATEPEGSEITLTGDDGLIARGVSVAGGGLLLARAGRYQMTVRKTGFVTHTETVFAEIGKPYSYFFQLARERGRLLVQVVPGNARVFLDDRFVGVGRYEAELPGDTYTLFVESPDRISERRKVEVKPKQLERVAVELSPKPQVGRTQLLLYSGVAGAAVLGGGLAGTSSSTANIAALSGLVAGGVAGYIAVPDDLRLGTSSLMITGSVGGGVLALLASLTVTDKEAYVGPATAIGLVVGGAAGFYIGNATSMAPGNAALINTGMLWGAVYGRLFSAVFNSPGTFDYSLTAGGIGLGLVTSSLLVRSFSISRSHAALIDLGGLSGLVLSTAVLGLLDRGNAPSAERQSNFSLGGLTLGLAGAALLTRNFDEPALSNIQPSIGRMGSIDGKSVTSYGFAARF
jgi:hypothetical protein